MGGPTPIARVDTSLGFRVEKACQNFSRALPHGGPTPIARVGIEFRV